jgi:glucokinase
MNRQITGTKSGRFARPVIAADIGGTKIMAALFDAAGKLIDRDVCPTLAEQGRDAAIRRMCATIEDLMKRNNFKSSNISAISIAAAGGVDTSRGVVVTPSPHLPGWADTPLADIFKEHFGIDTYVLNDASAAALGEHRYGVGKSVKHLVLFTLGTGIGGGIIIDGKLYLGAVGGAGELGHMTVEAHGLKCGCGNTGCLEMYASGSAIERDVLARLARGEKSSLADIVKKRDNEIRVEDVAAAARCGDKLADEAIAQAAFYLGIGFVNIINIFNPELIVYGGGMAELGEMIVGPGRKMAAERPFSINARAVRIVKAELANEAGIYGAAAFGLDMARRRKS